MIGRHPLPAPAFLRRLGLLLWLLLAPLGAQAHATLVGAQPADGATLAKAPTSVTLDFSEPVAPISLRLVDADGKAQTLEAWDLQGASLIITLPADLADGLHALSWRVSSADGHPMGGTLGFRIGADGAAEGSSIAPAEDTPRTVQALIWLVRLAFYLGLFFGIGALPFHLFVALTAPAARRLSQRAMGLGLLAILPALGLQGLDMLGAPLVALGTARPWGLALTSSYALTLLIGGLALAAGLVAWRQDSRPAALLAWAGVGAALAASGHASSAHPQWLMRSAVFLHGAAIAAWVGALPGFLLALHGADAQRMLRRFSLAILPVVAVLIAAGIVLARVQVGSPGALIGTAYGRVLLVKLGLLVLLFGLAALNRWRLTPAFRHGAASAARRLALSTRVEVLLVCTVLAVVGLWRFTPPPRALALAAPETAAAESRLHGATSNARLLIAPGHAGRVTATVFLQDAEGQPLDAQEVALALENPGAGIEPIRALLQARPDGSWSGLLLLPLAGSWQARLEVLISDFESTRLQGEIAISG